MNYNAIVAGKLSNGTVMQNFLFTIFVLVLDYVESIYQTFLQTDWSKLDEVACEIQRSAPLPMNTMLTKQAKTEAIEKWKKRKALTAIDVPGTAPLEQPGNSQSTMQYNATLSYF